jgi:hypothetical protein
LGGRRTNNSIIQTLNSSLLKFSSEQKIYYVLRIASAMCFIGHGSFGIIGKAIWANYFALFGVSHDLSFQLMPYVGTIDIFFGVVLLIYPIRAIVVWLVIWGAVTAFLRPLSGEPFPEFIERAGNFGAPLAMLLLCGRTTLSNLFHLAKPAGQLNENTLNVLSRCLRIAAFLLLAGHGWLNLVEKSSLLKQYTELGFANPANISLMVGLVEITGALSILIRPLRPVVFFFFIWKMGSELLYPHYELFEFVERGGSYGVLLALWFVMDMMPAFGKNYLTTFTRKLLVNPSNH